MCKGARCLYGHTPPTGKSAEIDSGNDDTLLDQVCTHPYPYPYPYPYPQHPARPGLPSP